MKLPKPGNDKGAAAVEFAIIMPVLLLLVFGIVEFSIIFFNKAMITNASREGARKGIVWRPNEPSWSPAHLDRYSEEEIVAEVETYLMNHLISFGNNSGAVIDVENAQGSTGTELVVTVDYPYQFLVLPNFMGNLAGDFNLHAKTIMRME